MGQSRVRRRESKQKPSDQHFSSQSEAEFLRKYLEWLNWEEPKRTPLGALNYFAFGAPSRWQREHIPGAAEAFKMAGLTEGWLKRPQEPPERTEDIYLPPPSGSTGVRRRR